jgi:hypothetical protein
MTIDSTVAGDPGADANRLHGVGPARVIDVVGDLALDRPADGDHRWLGRGHLGR